MTPSVYNNWVTSNGKETFKKDVQIFFVMLYKQEQMTHLKNIMLFMLLFDSSLNSVIFTAVVTSIFLRVLTEEFIVGLPFSSPFLVLLFNLCQRRL